jgi:hypothetical protein
VTALDTTGIDAVTGVATLASLDVRTADQWCVCTCRDDRHRALVFDTFWDDSTQQYVDRDCWRTDRAVAQRDLVFANSEHAHIVIRPARVVTGPVEVDEP